MSDWFASKLEGMPGIYVSGKTSFNVFAGVNREYDGKVSSSCRVIQNRKKLYFSCIVYITDGVTAEGVLCDASTGSIINLEAALEASDFFHALTGHRTVLMLYTNSTNVKDACVGLFNRDEGRFVRCDSVLMQKVLANNFGVDIIRNTGCAKRENILGRRDVFQQWTAKHLSMYLSLFDFDVICITENTVYILELKCTNALPLNDWSPYANESSCFSRLVSFSELTHDKRSIVVRCVAYSKNESDTPFIKVFDIKSASDSSIEYEDYFLRHDLFDPSKSLFETGVSDKVWSNHGSPRILFG